MMDVAFLLSHIPNPRMNKRIAIAKQECTVVVVCVRRASQDIWEPFHSDVPHEIIEVDLPSAKHILKRLRMGRQYKKEAIVFLNRYQPRLIYTGGLDSLAIAVRYQRTYPDCRIVYEVSDLREIYLVPPKGLAERILAAGVKLQEKLKIRHIDKLVVTSEKFYDSYYYQYVSQDKVLFIPNVPNTAVFSGYQKKRNGPFTVGFIGGIRYLRQMKMLVDATTEISVRVLFAGKGGTIEEEKEIRRYCRNSEHVTFFGQYAYESQIAELYGKVDCVYAVYDADNPNVQIALPNKLYESIYCELPILVAKGTYLAELVEQWGVGVAVSHTDMDDVIRGIKLLKDKEYYDEIVEACKKTKKTLFSAESESSLIAVMRSIDPQKSYPL